MSSRKIMPKIFFCGLLAGCLSGCASYRVKQLRQLNNASAKYGVEKNGVSIYTAPISQKELTDYFNGEKVPQKYVLQPFLLTVENSSSQTIIIHAHEADFKTVSADELSQMLELYTRPSKWNAAGIPLLTLLGMTAIDAAVLFPSGGAVFYCAAAAPLINTLVLISLVAVPCAMGIGWHVYATKRQFCVDFCADIHSKIFATIKLGPGENATHLMFVSNPITPLVFGIHRELEPGLWSKKEIMCVEPL